jgi:hypothetical protein
MSRLGEAVMEAAREAVSDVLCDCRQDVFEELICLKEEMDDEMAGLASFSDQARLRRRLLDPLSNRVSEPLHGVMDGFREVLERASGGGGDD